ncbi:hypothetical protein ALC56_08371 [Trachymyrmex septentrionalis]|uniref:Uncharacterized protein n=1 Tax=Trachymyrmex septentrionalis TaxID=34720 RepID=A0A195FA59_9HYME|nr:hypothetical protein ALC56_08371 [Trachymyrmex septentrionalis]
MEESFEGIECREEKKVGRRSEEMEGVKRRVRWRRLECPRTTNHNHGYVRYALPPASSSLLLMSSNVTRLTELMNADRKRAPRFGMPTRATSLDVSRVSIYEGLRGSLLPTTILLSRQNGLEFSDPRME